MTHQPLEFDAELARHVAGVLRQAVATGGLTIEDLEAARAAMLAGAVLVRRDDDGTFTVRIGSVVDIDGHILELPSVAAEWEAAAT